jgi:hypothetical protein
MATRIMAPAVFLLGLACSASGCGSPALVQCRVEAVKFLPEDPGQITPYDVLDLVHRLNECKRQGDAGP